VSETSGPRADGSPANHDRAAWAADSARAYADATGLDYDEEADIAISDLIASLLHLADEQGLCPETMLQRGQMHYEHEAAEEDADD
jgi:hypothetical protein